MIEPQATPEGEVQVLTREVPIVGGVIESRDLFKDNRELRIRHGGAIYRLRLTAQNKLILTK